MLQNNEYDIDNDDRKKNLSLLNIYCLRKFMQR